jgi:hypothetical protein
MGYQNNFLQLRANPLEALWALSSDIFQVAAHLKNTFLVLDIAEERMVYTFHSCLLVKALKILSAVL